MVKNTPSAVYQFHMLFRKSSALHRDLGSCALYFTEVVGGNFDVKCSEVLVQVLKLRRPRDRNDPRLLGEQPGERYLNGRRFLPFCDGAEEIDHCLIGFPGLRGEAGENGPEVSAAVEGNGGIDFPCEESLTQRAPWNEADPEFLACRQYFRSGSLVHNEYSLWRAVTG